MKFVIKENNSTLLGSPYPVIRVWIKPTNHVKVRVSRENLKTEY